MRTRLGRAGAAAAMTLATLAVASPAYGAQTNDYVDCGTGTLTLRVNDSNSSDNGGWSVAHVVDGGSGHLIPVAFSFTMYDETLDQTLFTFSSEKGNGHAGNQQQTTTCSEQFTGSLGDFLEPGETPPPGASLTDDVTATFTATAVWKS